MAICCSTLFSVILRSVNTDRQAVWCNDLCSQTPINKWWVFKLQVLLLPLLTGVFIFTALNWVNLNALDVSWSLCIHVLSALYVFFFVCFCPDHLRKSLKIHTLVLNRVTFVLHVWLCAFKCFFSFPNLLSFAKLISEITKVVYRRLEIKNVGANVPETLSWGLFIILVLCCFWLWLFHFGCKLQEAWTRWIYLCLHCIWVCFKFCAWLYCFGTSWYIIWRRNSILD